MYKLTLRWCPRTERPTRSGRPNGGQLQLATVSGDVTSGYTDSLSVGVDTTTEPTGGQLVGDGMPSGAAGAPGGAPGGPRP